MSGLKETFLSFEFSGTGVTRNMARPGAGAGAGSRGRGWGCCQHLWRWRGREDGGGYNLRAIQTPAGRSLSRCAVLRSSPNSDLCLWNSFAASL